MTPNTKGALLMIGSMTAFTVNDAFMKSLSGVVPLSQAVFLRGLMSTVLIFALAYFLGQLRLSMSPRDRRLILSRTVCEIGATYFFLTALFHMPLANISAIMQALPLTVTLCGAVFLGQAVGWRRWSAIAVGFGGVLLIVRPGLEGFSVYSASVLMAVVFVTIRDILARQISAEVPSLVIACNNALWITVAFGLASTQTQWAPLDWHAIWPIVLAAVTLVAAYFFAVATMRQGEIAVVAPFRYTSLVVAVVLGVVFFEEIPDTVTMIGAVIVVVTGLFTLWRDHQTRVAIKP